MPEYVHMHHPEVEGCAEAPEAAFNEVWEDKGWTLADTHEGQTVFQHELESNDEPEAVDAPEKPADGNDTKERVVVEGENLELKKGK